jgi:tRNA (guanine-N7-)-methyltransferase
MTMAQERAWRVLWPRFGLVTKGATLPFDWPAVFGRTAPLIFEIGFGMGQSLASMAATEPDKDFVGVEVHRPGVGSLLNDIEKRELSNLRIFCEDGLGVLSEGFADASLERLQLYFPDPWHKKRHHKRRMVQPPWVALAGRKLKPGGLLHMATDWAPYAEHMLAVMQAAEGFENTAPDFAPRPAWRPVTRFEQRGERLGHGVWDLIWRKT